MKTAILLFLYINYGQTKTVYIKTQEFCKEHESRETERRDDNTDENKQKNLTPPYLSVSAALEPEITELQKDIGDFKLEQDDHNKDGDINYESRNKVEPSEKYLEKDITGSHDDGRNNMKFLNDAFKEIVNNLPDSAASNVPKLDEVQSKVIKNVLLHENVANTSDIDPRNKLSYTDTSNIREVRARLLDHLLEYFVNIIKEEQQYTQTRKTYNKDIMRLAEKLRNYYNPEHLDDFLFVNGRRSADRDDVTTNNEDNGKSNVTVFKEKESLTFQQMNTENDSGKESIKYFIKKSVLKENDNNIYTADLLYDDHKPKAEENILSIIQNSIDNKKAADTEPKTNDAISNNTQGCVTCTTNKYDNQATNAMENYKQNISSESNQNDLNIKYDKALNNNSKSIDLKLYDINKITVTRKSVSASVPKTNAKDLLNRNTGKAPCDNHYNILQLNIVI